MRSHDAKRGLPWTACLLLLALTGASGCGDGIAADEKPEYTSDVLNVPPEKKKVPPPPQPRKVISPKDGEKALQAANPVPAHVNKPKPPLVPSDVGQWTEKDFLVAHRVGDSRLARAVQHRCKNPHRTAAEAETLVALLQMPTTADSVVPGSPSPRETASVSGPSAELVRAVIAALGANKTEVARQALVRLVNGDLPVPDPRVVRENALAPLVQHGSAELDAVIVQAVMSFVQADPSDPTQSVKGRTGLPPSVLAALRADASVSLRKRLAQAMLAEGIGPGQRDPLLKMLIEPQPENLEAEVLIYRNNVLDTPMRAVLEKQFATASAEVVRMFGGAMRQSHMNPPTPDWLGRVAGEVWSSPMVESLALAQEELLTMADRPAVMTLCATIPANAMRASLRRTILRHWPEGPRAFRGGAGKDGLATEPGFLVVLKSVERENSPGKRLSEVRSSLSKRPKAAKPVSEATQRSEPWIRLIEELMRDYCRRCHLASLAQVAADTDAAAKIRDAVAADCPVSLHPDGELRVAYRFDLPGEYASRLPRFADDSLRMDYLRIEVRAKPSRVVGFFRRQVKHGIERPLGDGVWLDSLAETDQEGRVRSQDIVITRAKANLRSSGEEEQELTIEILAIDVRNPER